MFSPAEGIVLIVVYGAVSFALTWATARGRMSKVEFLLAGRRLGVWESAFSIAATWIWAPALFLASEKAYTQGVAGVFWFTAPNVLCLIVFAFFAERIRRLAPRGVTLSEYMRERYSRRVQVVYLIQLIGLAACSFAVQLLAGGMVLASLTGLPFFAVTAALAAVALAYSLFSGLRASVVTDYAQMVVILAVMLGIVPWAVSAAGGWEVVRAGMGGRSGQFGGLVSGDSLSVAWSFGLPVTIGLMAGPFGDQSFWQRAFATQANHVRGAFLRGALVFAVVPLGLSLLGFLAAGMSWDVSDTALVNLEAVRRLLPPWAMLPMAVMLLSGLVSTLDSNLCAVSSLCGHDLLVGRGVSRPCGHTVVRVSRWSMVVLAIAGVAIANIPGMRILYLFLFYGTLRASTLLPTVFTLLSHRVGERGVFVGIVLAIGLGLPLFSYGNFTGRTAATVAGSLLTVLLPAVNMLLSLKPPAPGQAVHNSLPRR